MFTLHVPHVMLVRIDNIRCMCPRLLEKSMNVFIVLFPFNISSHRPLDSIEALPYVVSSPHPPLLNSQLWDRKEEQKLEQTGQTYIEKDMAKLGGLIKFFVPILVCLMAASGGQAYVRSSGVNRQWRASLGLGHERLTRLHFFFHDRVSGDNATVAEVATANITASSPTLFGSLLIADNPLTEGADPLSEEVGRAQGMYGSVGREEMRLIMAMSFSFSKGRFNGSSLSMLSQNPITNPVRELAIVGGTGSFRLARGIATLRTVEMVGLSAIVEYNVTVVHY